MSKYIKRFLSIVLLVFIVLSILSYTQVRFDHNNIRIEGFYKEEKNSIDVAVIGASEVYSDYSPVYAYEKNGYTSYNYSIEDNPLMLYKWELDEIFSYQNPKLVIIEITAATSDRKLVVDNGYFDATLRKISDSVPLSNTKFLLVNEFGKESYMESYFFPPIMYHGSIPKFETAQEILGFQSRGFSYLKGAVIRTNSLPCKTEDLYNVIKDNKMIPTSSEQEEILDDLLMHCREKQYPVVFARFPHRIENEKKYLRYCEGNYIKEKIRKNGFDFLDFEQQIDEIGLNKIDDFADGEHLRISGSKKFTEYLGNIIVQRYGIKSSTLNDLNRSKWDTCVKYIDSFYDYYEQVKDGTTDRFLWENNSLLTKLESIMQESL